jgi:hypothetical protein
MSNLKATKGSPIISYSVYHNDFKSNSVSMEYLSTLNMVIGTCKYLNNRNFQNIVIDLGREPYTDIRPKLLKPQISDLRFYVVGESRKDNFKAFFTNSISDILIFVNENLKLADDRFQVVQIVNCIPK